MMRKMFFRVSAITLIVASLINLLMSIPVFADGPGLHIEGASIVETISPGQSQVNTITISSPNDMDILVEADGLGQSPDGSTVPLSALNDNSSFSARTFITNIDKTSLHLAANVAQDIHVTVSVPSGTASGQKYAVVYIHQTVVQGTSIVVASYIPVIITVPTFTPNPQGTITSLTATNTYQGKPININTTFKNSGNCLITGGKNRVTITDTAGNQKWQNENIISSNSLIPNFPRLIVNTYNVGLSVGNYSAKSNITLADGTLLDTKTINFQVIQLPPIPGTPVLVSPGNNTTPGPIINTLLPTLQWNTVAGADSYELTLSRYPYTSSDVVFDVDQLTGTSYTLPAGILFGGEKYTWQLKATNISGSSGSSTMFYFQSSGSFAPPAVTSSDANSISSTGATLNGNLTAMGSSSGVAISFEYGTTTAYGSSTTPQMLTATGVFNAAITGLTPGTTYHFHAKAVGSSTVYGNDLTFTALQASTATTTTTPTTTNTTTLTSTTTATSTSITNNTTVSTIVPKSRSYKDYFTPIIDEPSLVYQDFTNKSTPVFDATDKTETRVSLTQTNNPGTVIAVKYLDEPQTSVQFSTGTIKGGTGKPWIKFVGVRIEGTTKGTARVTVHFTDGEVNHYQVESLFLAYFSDGSWHKGSNLAVSAQDNTVSADIPVARLTGTAIGLGGDLTVENGGVLFMPQSNNNTPATGIRWDLAGIVIVPILVVGGVILVIERNRKKSQNA